MALINSNNNYIKFYLDGRYEIYASETARNKVKASVPSTTILSKYQELLAELLKQVEFRYYDPEEFAISYRQLETEYLRYQTNLNCHRVGETYPIMAEIYPDVADSIPEIITAGVIQQTEDTLEKAYIKYKHLKRWGETTDA